MRRDADQELGEFAVLFPFSLAGVVFLFPPCPEVFWGMDDAWTRRLLLRPERYAFMQYAKLLRLLSGLNHVCFLRAVSTARQRKLEEDEECRLRCDPNVISSIRFLQSVSEQDLPIVISVITEGLFPQGSTGWFTAASPDPRVPPAAALFHVQSHPALPRALLCSALLYPTLLYSTLPCSTLLYTLGYPTLYPLLSTLYSLLSTLYSVLDSALLYSILAFSTLLHSTRLYSTLVDSSLL